MKMTAGGFAIIRLKFGSLSQEAVDNINLIVETCEKYNLSYPQTSYVLATVAWETARTFKPIEEYGKGKGRKYGTIYTNTEGVKYGIAGSGGDTYLYSDYPHLYYGRGHTQNTWLDNYEYIKQRTGVDVVNNPNLLLDSKLSAEVTVLAMKEGWYTGKKLSDYINDKKKDLLGARRIVNGNDKAQQIADIAVVMEKALRSY
jgi:putative chitinase